MLKEFSAPNLEFWDVKRYGEGSYQSVPFFLNFLQYFLVVQFPFCQGKYKG